MKVSIITVVYNNSSTIRSAIESVLSQTYSNIEYIVVDGASTDGTVEIVKSYGSKITKFISEPDKGIYNAMNKGVRFSTGDVVGILNSDDFFTNNSIIQSIVDTFDNDTDAIYGDVQFVDPNKISKVVRYFSSKRFKSSRFKYGFMPAHPSFYVRKKFYDAFGLYKEDYKIGADFELLVRFLYVNNLKTKYINFPFVSMRTGGISNRNFKSKIILNSEVLRACRDNGIKTNIFNIYSKYFFKIFEFVRFKV